MTGHGFLKKRGARPLPLVLAMAAECLIVIMGAKTSDASPWATEIAEARAPRVAGVHLEDYRHSWPNCFGFGLLLDPRPVAIVESPGLPMPDDMAVPVSMLIDGDGRVAAVLLPPATDREFARVAEAQIRTHWRFDRSKRGSVVPERWQSMIAHFRPRGDGICPMD